MMRVSCLRWRPTPRGRLVEILQRQRHQRGQRPRLGLLLATTTAARRQAPRLCFVHMVAVMQLTPMGLAFG